MAFEIDLREGTTPMRERALGEAIEELEAAIERHKDDQRYASHVSMLRRMVQDWKDPPPRYDFWKIGGWVVAAILFVANLTQTYFTIWPRTP